MSIAGSHTECIHLLINLYDYLLYWFYPPKTMNVEHLTRSRNIPFFRINISLSRLPFSYHILSGYTPVSRHAKLVVVVTAFRNSNKLLLFRLPTFWRFICLSARRTSHHVHPPPPAWLGRALLSFLYYNI